jgi:hypothetical protein
MFDNGVNMIKEQVGIWAKELPQITASLNEEAQTKVQEIKDLLGKTSNRAIVLMDVEEIYPNM